MVPQIAACRQSTPGGGRRGLRSGRLGGPAGLDQGLASKRFAATFLRTASGRQIRPFIAM
jgi:hypothetical protein